LPTEGGINDTISNARTSMAECWNRSFTLERAMYLIIVDYFSRFIEIAKLYRTNAAEVIEETKKTLQDMVYQKS
jgi:hypothetical protein